MRAELHFHLLPGVDDGPVDDEEALELARLAVDDGTAVVVATPHVRMLELGELEERVGELRARLRERRIPLEVRPGGELHPADLPELDDDDLDLIAQGPRGARFVLLEAPLGATGPEELEEATGELRRRGFGVLLAHPERSSAVLSSGGALLRRELAAGTRLQVNASSLDGRHGPVAREHADDLVASGVVAAIASDAHSPARPPLLTCAEQLLTAHGVGPGTAAKLTAAGPRRLLERGFGPRAALAARS